MQSSEIRKKFINFFESKGHMEKDSSSLIPSNDPTLLFTNAGMVPFKDFFTGAAKPPKSRVTTVQKCVRAGGKHNDLDNVGFTSRHHTFFEMLGNFSFGDYFKKEAISFAWEFLTQEMNIPKSKLYVTVHHTDQEAADIWHEQEGVPRDRIFFLGDKDNFWEMGPTGPCGPSSEIFYDHGEENSDPNADTSECILADEMRYVEIWNLVFMQFERYMEDGEIKQRSLPNPCVDTGAGLERVAGAVQGVYNNFDTDLFTPVISELSKYTKITYAQQPQFMRVVADHARATTMLLADGVIPSNEGRGYVLRRIIRRAVLHLDYLGIKDITLFKLVDAVFDCLNHSYPENEANKDFIQKYLKNEEESFRRTLNSGLKLLEAEMKKLGDKKQLSGDVAFTLYDTHGFPADLTQIILDKNNMIFDQAKFNQLMQEQKERSKKASNFGATEDASKEFYKVKEDFGTTEFTGYDSLNEEATLLFQGTLGGKPALVFNKTPFYAEGGGQAGDQGMILENGKTVAKIIDTQKPVDDLFVHLLSEKIELKTNASYELQVDPKNRNLTARNHTATHLLQAALIKVLGNHVKQAGSQVSFDKLRFDFTHPEALKKEEILEVEKLVNEQIQAETSVSPETMTKDEALKKGAMALFGEKYGNEVRVIDIPGFSVELCGGTHVQNTNEIGYFKITLETSLAAGVRRIEAVSSQGALDLANEKIKVLSEVEKIFNVKGEKVLERIEQFQNDLQDKNAIIKQLKDQLNSLKSDDLFKDVETLSSGQSFKYIDADSEADIRKLGDLFINKFPNGIALISSPKGDKLSVILKTFRKNDQVNCSKILKDVFSQLDGRGGGKPDMAQGSIPLVNKEKIEDMVKKELL